MCEATRPDKNSESAGNILSKGSETWHKRNVLYGSNYYQFGEVMRAIFPDGIQLKSADDFNRFGILTQKVAKLTRYCANFNIGGHQDSIHDDMVYSAMLEEIDGVIKEAMSEA